MSSLVNIRGDAQIVDGLKVYPIRIKDWDKFEDCSKVLLISKSHFDIPEGTEIPLLELLVRAISDTSVVSDLEEIFRLCLRDGTFEIVIENNDFAFMNSTNQFIHSGNYELVRKAIMEQNLLFEPKVYKDPLMQKWAQKVLEARSKNAPNITLEDMISTVAALSGKHYCDLDLYTVYQIRSEFERHCKVKDYDVTITAQMNSTEKLDIVHFAENINLFKNPYDDVFKSKDKLKNANNALGG